MIDNYLLEYLVTFAKYQTLAKTATALNVTQPTVTRGMQKLEEQLDVELFERTPNRIVLTKTGKLAARKAQKLLLANQNFVTQIKNYAITRQIPKVATDAPGPRFILEQFNNDELNLDTQLSSLSTLENDLLNNKYNLVIAEKEIHTDTLESRYLGYEDLYVNLDKFTYQANQATVCFDDLAQMSFVVLGDIGPWKDIIQTHIPKAKFLFQQEYDALKEITNYSSFPYFSTNVTQTLASRDNAERVRLKITDSVARMDFYGIYRKDERTKLTPLLQKLSQNWPK
ncbi:LysR family transcriptional regulator [Ligilactobacillus animalis]|nr:LysR family transcriptional regulator [Ligilactobacillus animalis]